MQEPLATYSSCAPNVSRGQAEMCAGVKYVSDFKDVVKGRVYGIPGFVCLFCMTVGCNGNILDILDYIKYITK